MPVVLVGLNHRTAPVALRERLYISRHTRTPVLAELCALSGIQEAVILATCNRAEFYAYGEDPREIVAYLAAHAHLAEQELRPHLYVREDRAAVMHLFRVACGLDSLMIGETQVLGQAREAVEDARTAGAAGRQLTGLFEQAIAVGKRARAETGISDGAFSVGRAAVELARSLFPDLRDRQILLLGAGKMSELTARHLAANGARTTLVANRTHAHAVELAARLGGRAIYYQELDAALREVDIVISSTSAPHYMLYPARVADIMAARAQRPLCFIDIALPRDIDPAVGELPHVCLYNIDALQGVTEQDRCRRMAEVPRVEALIAEETARWSQRQAGLHAAPIIAALHDSFEQVRQAEMARQTGLLATLTPEQQAAVDRLTASLVGKLLYTPTVRLKEAIALHADAAPLDLLCTLFDLSDPLGEKEHS